MRFRNKKVLVTGGAGFVGSNLVKALHGEGAHIIVLDDLSTGDLSFIGDKVIFAKGSVTDYNRVEAIVKSVDIIFHLAAKNIITSIRNPMSDFKTNIGGTLNVLVAAAKERPRIERVVYASSASVYGNPKRLPINEDDPTITLNPYAVSKLSGELYCTAFNESYGVPTTILRYSNVYGTNQSPENPYCGVVAKFFDSVLNNKPVQIHGDGEQTRDFTYVDDAVEATLLAALKPKAVGEIFNVGTGIETSVNELTHLIDEVTETFGRDFEYVDRRDIDNLRRRVLNVEKTRRYLRWIPETILYDGLAKTYEWLLEARSKKMAGSTGEETDFGFYVKKED